MASNQGRSRRHAHKKKGRDAHGHTSSLAARVCKLCGKQCYRSRDEAKRATKIIHPGQVMHFYDCEESPGIFWWHSSSIPADQLKKLRDREHYA